MELLSRVVKGPLQKKTPEFRGFFNLSNMKKFQRLFYCFVSFLVFMIFAGCKNKKQREQPAKEITSFPANYKKPSSGFSDTLFVDKNAAVFFDADSLQREKISKLIPKMNYENDTHDCIFQTRNARNVIHKNWPALKAIDALAVRFICFIGNHAQQTVIDLDSQNLMCGIYLFEVSKKPVLIDMMNIDTELGFYFKHD